MKLDSEFYRLPLKYDVERLKYEVDRFSENDWMPHPSGFQGNASIPLLSVGGEKNDLFIGEISQTQALKKCKYIQQIFSDFNEVFGRSRLMRLAGGAEVPLHADLNYHWRSHVRIHIPVVTSPNVLFHCGEYSVHMAEGEAWIFDAWKMHKVVNASTATRIHLVIDTVGSSRFWGMVAESDQPHKRILKNNEKFIPYIKNKTINVKTEKYNANPVMAPGELAALCEEVIQDVVNYIMNDRQDVDCVAASLRKFHQDWRCLWLRYGSEKKVSDKYKKLVAEMRSEMNRWPDNISLASNNSNAKQVVSALILSACINVDNKQIKPNLSPENRPIAKNSPCFCGSGLKYKRCHGKT